jgi:hypothetical protein
VDLLERLLHGDVLAPDLVVHLAEVAGVLALVHRLVEHHPIREQRKESTINRSKWNEHGRLVRKTINSKKKHRLCCTFSWVRRFWNQNFICRGSMPSCRLSASRWVSSG